MQYLTDTGLNLVDIVDFSDEYFQNVKLSIIQNAKSTSFFDVLEQCREIIRNNKAGSNILRYLLYHLKNRVIKEQINSINERLSGLYLNYGCIPFDVMPFNSSLISHNPKLWDVFDCINPSDRKHELFARLIRKNTEINGQLFTPIKDISDFDNIETLKDTYNKKLYYKHQGRKLEINKGHIYIKEYKDDTQFNSLLVNLTS
ncbi:MAG: hypothetical protein ACTFAL_07575 [Candidatus Electronema sp. V4]|uniref:hypothetical protein n=1 Tax=Candidatus Electronema sp. V4 TaxID=3454756 RepID=UPI0040557305